MSSYLRHGRLEITSGSANAGCTCFNILIFDCTDTEMRNFQGFKKWTLRKTLAIFLLN